MPRLSSLLVLLAAACGGDAADSATLCEAGGATSGQVTGTLDGRPWAVDATWSWSGDAVQVTTSTADGWRMTLVAQRDVDGRSVREASEQGGGSVTVDLSADDGFAVLYPEAGGTSLSSKEGSGLLVLTDLGTADGSGTVAGCLSFDAKTAGGGESVALVGGLMSATPL